MFSNIIKTLRKEAGLTQTELAQKLSIKQTTVSCWETGKAKPSPEMLMTLAKLFHVSVDYLLGTEAQSQPAIPSEDDPLKDIQFALFGTHDEISEEMMEDVKAYARFKLEQWKKQGKL